MFWGDHNPPHFHAYYQENEAEYDIRSLEQLEGYLPASAHKMVMKWANNHREELFDNWMLCTEEEPLRKIEPLA